MGHAHLGLSRLQLEAGNSWKQLAIAGMYVSHLANKKNITNVLWKV